VDKETTIRTLDSSIFLKECAFVRWRGQWHFFQGPLNKESNSNNSESSVFSICCTDFFGHNPQSWSAQEHIIFDSNSWRSQLKAEGPSHFLARSFEWRPPLRELYSKSFQSVQTQIHSGNWKKAVPIAFSSAEGTLSDSEKLAILLKLAEAPEPLIPYGYWKDGEGMMGLTPEILFFREGSQLLTMALAGTEKKQGRSHLLDDDKNLKEHDFVVQELREKLSRFGEVSLEGPQILELPTLYHLFTKFSVKLKTDWDDLKALQYLHPTSALGISPFSKWKELETLPEQKDRRFFGSPLLFNLSSDSSLALVCLRQIQWDEQKIRIGAGGGVVRESQEELEWNEILAKMDSVKKLMGIA
jgi:menaquinone-specific isochorismate synthase